jgi:hypothetical protein
LTIIELRREGLQVYFVPKGEGLFVTLGSFAKLLGRQARLFATLSAPAIHLIQRRECVPFAVLIEFAPSEDQERLKQLGEEFIAAARQALGPTDAPEARAEALGGN